MPCCTTKLTGKHLRSPPQPLTFLPSWARFLNTVAASAGSQARRNYGRHWTPVHLDFVVEDLDAAVQRAHAQGPRSNLIPKPMSGGGSLSWLIRLATVFACFNSW